MNVLHNWNSRAFSFIELVVSIAILLLLIGGLLSSYTNYNQNQAVRQATLTVKANLRLAQSKALSAAKPTSGCTELMGYTVSFTGSGYSVQASCTEGLVGTKTDIALPGDLTLSPVPADMTFGVLTRGLKDSANSVTISLVGYGKTYQLVVSPNGDITDVGFQ